jgi:predicted phosphodiesterase
MYRQHMKENFPTKTINLGKKAFVFGGAYGNLQATIAILEKAKELGFDKSEIIFTGDTVAYCANPIDTAQLIRDSVDHIVMGNCEEAIATGSASCGCGFEVGTECSILSNQWYNFCLSKIDSQTADWMGSLPRNIIATIGIHDFLVTHATPHSINQFVFPSNLCSANDSANVDGYIVGHSGIPMIDEINGKPWLNSGASGMSANDGTSSVSFATITSNGNHIQIEIHRLGYNFVGAQSAMLSAALVNGYMDCLASGIWPSHDVLPDIEKAQTGIALQAQKKTFNRTPLRSLSSA